MLSIPKKVVRLATERNRLKRLLRVAVGKEPVFKAGPVYYLRVVSRPKRPTLADVQAELKRMLHP